MVKHFNPREFYRRLKEPFIIYEEETLLAQLDELRKAFSKTGRKVDIFYSYKTNPLLARILYQNRVGMEVTCKEHLVETLSFCKGENIILTSPCLDDSLILKCLDNNVHIIGDSIEQIIRIDNLSKSKVEVGLRINTGILSSKNHLVASGSSFGLLGISESKLKDKLKDLKLKNVKIVGLHNHFASQNVDLTSWEKNAEKILTMAEYFNDLQYVNLGGGFPVDYQDNSPKIEKIVSNLFGPLTKLPKDVKIVLEPGRFLAGPSGTLFAGVIAIKKDLVNTIFLDTSIFSTFPDRLLSNFTFNPPLELINKDEKESKNEYYIRGNSPSSVDFFGILKHAPQISIGDIIAVKNIGAYGTVEASSFCGSKKPKEFIVSKNSIKEVGSFPYEKN